MGINKEKLIDAIKNAIEWDEDGVTIIKTKVLKDVLKVIDEKGDVGAE